MVDAVAGLAGEVGEHVFDDSEGSGSDEVLVIGGVFLSQGRAQHENGAVFELHDGQKKIVVAKPNNLYRNQIVVYKFPCLFIWCGSRIQVSPLNYYMKNRDRNSTYFPPDLMYQEIIADRTSQIKNI